VPLSSIILIGEIILCLISPLEPVANFIGSILHYFIRLMNGYVEWLDGVSFAVWDGLFISPLQAVMLYFIIAGASLWLMEKQRKGLIIMLVCSSVFLMIRSISFIEAAAQKKLIVYNVPRHQAIDIINGRSYHFIGDAALAKDDFLRNFHIQPSRVLHRIKEDSSLRIKKSFRFLNKQIVIADTAIAFKNAVQKPVIDILILSKNPKVYMNEIVKSVTVKQVVVDGSVPAWKAKLWKRDCDSLHIPFYDVTQNGAFVMKL
jgi:competence protein ComEC